MLYCAWIRVRVLLVVVVMSVFLVASVGMPATRTEARVQPISVALPKFRTSSHPTPDLSSFSLAERDRKSLSRDLVKLRGKLFPAQVLQIFKRELSAEQLLKITQMQGAKESGRLLTSVGLLPLLRKELCGKDKDSIARLLAFSGDTQQIAHTDLAQIWPELNGEIRDAVSDATRRALAASCAYQYFYGA